ncbi:hypothetical protein FF2_045939 [Malus domestica]
MEQIFLTSPPRHRRHRQGQGHLGGQQQRRCSHQNLLSLFCVIYTPDEDVWFIFGAPNFGAAGFAPRPLATDRGFALVEGGGAAIAAHGSSSSTATLAIKTKRRRCSHHHLQSTCQRLGQTDCS